MSIFYRFIREKSEEIFRNGGKYSFILYPQYYSPNHNNENTRSPRKAAVLENRPLYRPLHEPNDHQEVITNQTMQKIKHFLEIIDKNGIPDCLRDKFHAEAFADIVYMEALTSRMNGNQLEFAFDIACNRSQTWDEFPSREKFWAKIMAALNRGRMDCSIAIGKILGLHPEYCFNVFPISQQKPLTGSSTVNFSLPDEIQANGLVFKLAYTDTQKAINGNIIYAICRYQAGKQNIFMLACSIRNNNGSWRLATGLQPAPAELLSQASIIKNPKAHVFICTDLDIASRFREIAKECKILAHKEVIVTGFVGGIDGMKNLPLSALSDHPVTIISQPRSETSYALARFAMKCEKAGASDVRLFPWPVHIHEEDFNSSDFNPERQQQAHSHCICLNGNYPASNLIDQILIGSIGFDSQAAWMKEFLMRDERNGQEPDGTAMTEGLKFHAWDELPDSFDVQADGSVEMRKMFSPQNATLLWGPSNAGKSWVSIQIAVSLATGTACFIWAASKPCKVGYFDGEVRNDLKARVNQLLQTGGNNELLKKNFQHITPEANFDMLNAKHQEKFITLLKEHRIECLLIDNLLSLAPKIINNNVSSYFDFIGRLKEIGISVITIHHANKSEGEYKGPADLAALHQNVIHIEGRDQLAAKNKQNPMEFNDKGCAEIQTAIASEDRVVIKMTATKTKVNPWVENKPFFFKLPFGRGWEQVGNYSAANAIAGPVEEDQTMSHDDLTENEQKTMQYFMQNPDRAIRNADIQQLLKLGEGACRNILNKLTERRMIEKHDTGIKTRYKLIAPKKSGNL